MHRRWLVKRTNDDFLESLSKNLSISRPFAQILINRGIKDIDSVRAFLSPSLNDLHDPFLLNDMDKAIERIKIAIDKDETVFIYGDYDADGITATSLLLSALRRLGVKACYHIPNRVTEGYGLSKRGIDKARACDAKLIITADCGISAIREIDEIVSGGIDVIVTDHHEPHELLPHAFAVINPHRRDSIYPFKELSGVGVVYKLVQALFLTVTSMPTSDTTEYLDLVTIGTVADSVPLTGENRVFVIKGLGLLNNDSCRVGIEALKESAGIKNRYRGNEGMSSTMLSYTLIPRINAAGRLDDASDIVELFLTDDEEFARTMADTLEGLNRKRQRVETEVFESALKMIDHERLDSAIVLSDPSWHQGVIGIVASRLVGEFYRPTFLFSQNETIAKGSARSIPPFHIYKGIEMCSDLLLGYGGHSQAAGVRILIDKLPIFKERINRIVEETLTPDDLIPTLEIDTEVRLSDVNFNLINELALLEPFGEGNREPLLGAKGVEITGYRVVGNGHLKMMTRQRSVSIDTIGFNMGELIEMLENATVFDIVFTPSINEWNHTRTLQLNLKAIRPSC
ncbi:MAG: single-stranded-DNA-specific exonuclease RecJ [Thermodesulfovibrionia bacterium]